jgi:hypothetical protein
MANEFSNLLNPGYDVIELARENRLKAEAEALSGLSPEQKTEYIKYLNSQNKLKGKDKENIDVI